MDNMNTNLENDVLTEQDFYPPYDDRIHKIDIDDINGGNSYEDYVVEFWELYEDELY